MANTLKFGNGEWYGKKDTILAYNDENSNYKPLPFNFSRASKATVINKDGLIEEVGSGQPRIDYKDDSKGALLLEPSRTNRLTNSEDGSSWSLSNITLSSLNGGLNKEYYEITSLGNTGRFDVVSNNWVNTTSGTYTASVLAKKGTSDEIILTTRANYGFQNAYSVFDLTSGTVVGSSGVVGSIEPHSDGWYRCSITFTNSGGYNDFASFAFGFNFNSSSTDTLFVASPQSEIGSYPTSYIPTQGSAVTRLADQSIIRNLDTNIIPNSSSWTAFFEIELLGNESPQDKIQLSDDSNNPRVYLYASTAGVSGTGWSGSEVLAMNTNNKIVYRANTTQNISFFENGVNEATFSSTSNPLTFNRLNLYGSNGAFRVKKILLYSTALTDGECIALTQV